MPWTVYAPYTRYFPPIRLVVILFLFLCRSSRSNQKTTCKKWWVFIGSLCVCFSFFLFTMYTTNHTTVPFSLLLTHTLYCTAFSKLVYLRRGSSKSNRILSVKLNCDDVIIVVSNYGLWRHLDFCLFFLVVLSKCLHILCYWIFLIMYRVESNWLSSLRGYRINVSLGHPV